MKTLYYDVKCEVWHRTSFEVPDDTTLDVILKAIDSDLLMNFNVESMFLYETAKEILPQETNGQPIAKSNCYASLAACYNGIDSLRRNVESEIIEQFKDADQG